MNSFIQPYIAGTQYAAQCVLYDARSVRSARSQYRRDALPLLEYANHFYCPTGRLPSRGWILLSRSDYNKLNVYSDSFQLDIGDPTQQENVDRLQNLSIVHAQCVTRGIASDPNALYLVELTDDRGILHNNWFQAPITKAYNIRAPAYPLIYYSATMNGAVPWTWATMLQDMWTTMNVLDGGNILGAWPGLPITPSGYPEGFWFIGVSAWYALNDVLDYLGLTIACDLTQANPFSIVVCGANDAVFDNLQTRYATVGSPLYSLEDDSEWIDLGAGRVPLNVVVLFRRRNQIYGTEETVRDDSLQWSTTSYYSVTVRAPASFTFPVGTHYIWSDFRVEYDQDGNPLAADVTNANAIANERVTEYFNRIYGASAGRSYVNQTYAGALPFYAGSRVDGVCWYMDPEGDGGWRTKISSGAYPPFKGVWD